MLGCWPIPLRAELSLDIVRGFWMTRVSRFQRLKVMQLSGGAVVRPLTIASFLRS